MEHIGISFWDVSVSFGSKDGDFSGCGIFHPSGEKGGS